MRYDILEIIDCHKAGLGSMKNNKGYLKNALLATIAKLCLLFCSLSINSMDLPIKKELLTKKFHLSKRKYTDINKPFKVQLTPKEINDITEEQKSINQF